MSWKSWTILVSGSCAEDFNLTIRPEGPNKPALR
eukprot:CAMPEP_0115144678 /NCGR_PEP_ID=MMETSP0227-20121206/61663_1 /TAXON_ID=89957 /ORGANISM="Polarella glacialis, Strain CCMP 1383" /LENGTH=33 /DNA_ID= /DNA_START= /DNA_END= /DNA_ORIENTATION=